MPDQSDTRQADLRHPAANHGPIGKIQPSEHNGRHAVRIQLPPMYTLVRVRPEGNESYCWTGYIYDISSSGMRFELDAPVDPGTRLEVRAMLPGNEHTSFDATGTVVRIHDDEDDMNGPVRMGMNFDQFNTMTDERKLKRYLAGAAKKAA